MPSAWESVPLEDILAGADGLTYGIVQPGQHVDGGVPIVRVASLADGVIADARPLRVDPSIDVAHRRTRLHGGEVLLSVVGTVGRVAVVPSSLAGWNVARAVAVLRPRNPSDARWLRLVLESPEVQKAIQVAKTDTVQATLNLRDIRRLAIPMPPRRERDVIAGVLGVLDDLIDTNHRLASAHDELGMALFRQAWDGQLTCAIRDLGDVTMGQSPPGSTYNEDSVGLVFFQGVRDFGDRYPTRRVFCTAPTRRAAKGDILIAVRAPVGQTNVALEDTAIGRGLAALRALQPSLALRALRARADTWAPHQGTGTVFSSISGPDLRAARVPAVTDPALQSRLAVLDAQHLACIQEIEQLRRARDELLPLLMSGRVTVREVAA